jgi:hypothetical protein
MKKTNLILAAAIVSIGFMACQDKKATTTTSTEVLYSYVDSVERLTPVYTTEYWTAIDNGYRERMALAEKDFADLSAEERTRAEAVQARYAALRSNYELKIRELQATPGTTPAYKVKVRNMLFGEGKVGDDLSFAYVNGQNIRSVYETFVDNVTHNKDRFNKEEWDEVAALYGALDARKEAIEKDIDAKDNLVIAKLKVKYTAVYATNKYGEGN